MTRATRGHWLLVAALGGLLGLLLGVLLMPRVPGVPVMRLVVDTTFGDVAASIPKDQVIAIDPTRLVRVPPPLATFFLTHELGHLALHHVPGKGDRLQVELDADCWAARHVGPEERAIAIRFFSLLGPVPINRTHPAGTVRALKIL